MVRDSEGVARPLLEDVDRDDMLFLRNRDVEAQAELVLVCKDGRVVTEG